MRLLSSRVAALLVLLTIVFTSFGTAIAQTNSATVNGTIIDVATSLPVNGATVTLYRGDTRIGDTTTDNSGGYSFASPGAGAVHIEVRANGYSPNRSGDVFVTSADQSTTIRTALQRTSESSSLREIGRVTATTSTLQTSSTVTQTISAERLERENYTRAADALGTLPGINLNGLDSAIGDDVYVNIRGLKATETQTLIDGHPVGPFGIISGQGGSENFGAYNYDLSPFFALRGIDVTYGAGALSTLWGPDGFGGTINFQTLEPTRTPQATFQQGFGDQGRATTSVTASGSLLDNKIGYVVSHGVQGTYGQFKPGDVFQTGLLTQDLSSGGVSDAGAVYQVSGNYLLRQDLAKLRFNFSNATNLTLTSYLGSEFDDKTGNGDNDYLPYATRLAQVNGNLANLNTFTPSGATVPTVTCATGQVAVNTNAGGACQTPQQFSAETSGPFGGGSGRFQTILNQDYDARLSTQYKNNNVIGDVFIDRYNINTTRSSNVDTNVSSTFGYLIADNIATGDNNTFAFGNSQWVQRLDGNNLNPGLGFSPKNSLGQAETQVFVRDDFTPISQLSFFANVYLKNNSNVPDENRIDPRLTIVGRVTPNDVVRLSGARTQGFPSVYALQGSTSFGSAGSTHYTCNGLTNIGNTPAGTLRPEDGRELDLSYGHRFGGDSQIQIALYNTNVVDPILGGVFPLTNIPGVAQNAQFLANFNNSAGANGYLGFYQAACGQTPTLANFSVSSTLNAGAEKAQGIELSGRYRLNPRLYFDYFYDLQQAAYYGISDANLERNVTLVNGGQIGGIPRNRAGLAVDVNDGKGAEIRVDGFYTGSNNELNGPPYAQFNGSVSKTFRRNTTLNFGIQNLFNNNGGAYGRIGDQVFSPENQFGTDTNSVDQANNVGGERFFLPPRSFQFSLSQRV